MGIKRENPSNVWCVWKANAGLGSEFVTFQYLKELPKKLEKAFSQGYVGMGEKREWPSAEG